MSGATPVQTRRRRGAAPREGAGHRCEGYAQCVAINAGVREVGAASLDIWQAYIAAYEVWMSPLVPGARCFDIAQQIDAFFEDCDLLQYRFFRYGHSFGVLPQLSIPGGRAGPARGYRHSAGTGHGFSLEPMLIIAEGQPGAGCRRELAILAVKQVDVEGITACPYGPDVNMAGPDDRWWRQDALVLI